MHAVCTSPPFWGLRRYSAPGHLGLEKSPITYVYKLVRVFREVRRVLRDDAVLWVNLGGCYCSGDRTTYRSGVSQNKGHDVQNDMPRPPTPTGYKPGNYIDLPGMVVRALQADGWWWRQTLIVAKKNPMPESVSGWRWERHRVKVGRRRVGWKDMPKGWDCGEGSHDDIGAGNYRQAGKREATTAEWSPCPGCPGCSPNDGLILRRGSWRATIAHEYVFMLAKSQRYWADGEAVKQIAENTPGGRLDRAIRRQAGWLVQPSCRNADAGSAAEGSGLEGHGAPPFRNLRSVLSLATQPYAWALCKGCQEIYSPERFRRLHLENGRRVCGCGAKDWLSHYATFPEALVEPLIKASTSERGCCPMCGAGWARVVERNAMEIRRTDWGLRAGNRTASSGTMVAPAESRTLDWRPTCACPPHAPIPAIVLDPFSGSGTVPFVAAKLGRKGIGVDLSWEYSRMAEARIAKGDCWDPPAVPERQMTLGI